MNESKNRIFVEMQDILDKITSIEGKLRHTLTSLHSANERNKVLTEENQNLHKERVQLLEQVSAFEMQIPGERVEGMVDSNEGKDIVQVKEKLRDYISEIDNCIELLKN